MEKIDPSLQNLVVSLLLVFLFSEVYYPIVISPVEPVTPPAINSDIQVLVESPSNVLSGTTADIKIIMNNPERLNIVVKGIEYRFSDNDYDNIYVSKTSLDFELWDHHETMLQIRIPEIYQLDKIAETDIPVSCTVVVQYEHDGVEEWTYTSYNMNIYDRFLETENTEREFNNEPVAIT